MLLDYDVRSLNMRFMSSDVYRQIWLKFARQKPTKPEQDVWHSVPDGNEDRE